MCLQCLLYSSQASLDLGEIFRSISGLIRFLINLIKRIAISYNYFLPEFEITKCMINYMSDAYPHLQFYQYPGQLLSDVFKAFERIVGEERKKKVDVKEALVYENVKEEDDEDIPNSTVDTYYNEEENEIFGARALESPRYMRDSSSPAIAPLQEPPKIRWQMCAKIYSLETVARYIIVNYILE